MNKLMGAAILTFAAAAGGALTVGAASAADLAAPEPVVVAEVTPNWDVAFGVAGVTDYRFRGITNSDKDPAVQGYAELQLFDWIYAGIWGSSVSFPERFGLTDPSMEIDFYGGVRHTWDSFTLDVGGLYYYYPGEKAPGALREIDYWEIYAKPSIAFGDFGSLTGNIYWTSDFVNSGADALYLSIIPKVNVPLASFPDLGFYISGEIGKQWIDKTAYAPFANDYLTWNIGAGLTYKAMTLEVRYSDTDLSKNECIQNSGNRKWCGDAVVGKIAFDTSLNKLK
jgi:uncharacterized protein (TIGR02001 family)